MIKSEIIGANEAGEVRTAQIIKRNGHEGIVAFTRDLQVTSAATFPLSNPIYGRSMNQAVAFSGTPDNVHDGEDSTLWTASALSGTWVFNDTTHAYQGIITISDYTALAGDTMTVNADVVTEGVEWTAATSNDATATSLASAIDALSDFSSTATGAVVEVIAANAIDITTFTPSDAVNMPATAAGIDGTGANDNNEAQLERSSSIVSGDYVAYCGRIYITSWSTSGSVKEVSVRLRLAGVDVGNEINISTYIDTSLFNEWQGFIIPVEDFESDVIDQVIIKNNDTGAGQAPNFYLDKMEFQESAGFIDFSFAPPPDKRLYVTQVGTTFVDNITESAARNPLAILGAGTLANGILLLFEVSAQTVQTLPARSIQDLIKFSQVSPVETVSDGTTTLLKITGNTEIVLDGRSRDKITYRIQDDLSSLIDMEVWIFGQIEDVS